MRVSTPRYTASPPMGDTLVLCYHAVATGWPDAVAVTQERFARQISMLDQMGYRGVTFTEAVEKTSRGHRVAVTFDDGFHSVLTDAFPVLARFGWPGTIYVVADYVGGERPIAWPTLDEWLGTPHEPQLRTVNWDQLRRLRDSGWEVGSHTCTHPHLTKVPAWQLRHELERSREVVTARLGDCPSIAYPYGDVDASVTEAARSAGYRAGTGLPGRPHQMDRFDWPRVGVYLGDNLLRFAVKSLPPRRQIERLAGRVRSRR